MGSIPVRYYASTIHCSTNEIGIAFSLISPDGSPIDATRIRVIPQGTRFRTPKSGRLLIVESVEFGAGEGTRDEFASRRHCICTGKK
ncbi:MAG: hypothetical protein JNL96_14380 [Planctomycetaceae bacterium]|nr:hypothetical protein [Planctomycetaceae bacterium]